MKRPLFLSTEEAARVHAATLRVLEKTGVQLDHAEAQSLYLEAGATKDEEGRILIPQHLVEEALEKAPAEIQMYDRDGEASILVRDGKTYFGPGSDALYNIDRKSGEFSQDSPELSEGRYVSLVVEDNGRGMDESTRQRLFEPFYTTKFQGRGLGMAAVYGIIRNHGGWIKVDSEIGRGTRIIIYFPSVDDVPLQDKSGGVSVALGTETILLVEDDDVVVDISQKILTRLGYQTLVAKTGEEAIKIFKKTDEKFDLVLLDMKLPDIDDKIVFSTLKETRPDTKVIIFSGYCLDGPVQEILDAGADGFVQKPFSLSTLSTQIRVVLGK